MAQAQGIRAGAAYVEVFVKDNRLVKGLAAAGAKLKAFGASIASLGQQFLAISLVRFTPLVAAVAHFTSAGDHLAKMAKRTGLSTEALSELGFAAEQSGADLETLEMGIKKMQKLLGEAAQGSKSAQETLGRLGLSVRQLMQLSPEEQFKAIADRLARIADPTLRAAMALEIFGKSGTKLIPLLSEGRAGIEALQEEARRLGLSLGGKDAKAAEDMKDAWNRLMRTIKASAMAIGAALAPTLLELLETVTRVVVGVINWIRENKELVATMALLITLDVALAAGLVAIGTAISAVGAVLSGIGTALGLIGSLIGALLSPIGLVVAALAGLAVWFVTSTDAGAEALGWLGEQFDWLKGTAMSAWQGISDAIAAGDLGLAARIAWLGLKMVWQTGIAWLEDKWITFKDFFVEIVHQGFFAVMRFLNDAWAGIQTAWAETVAFLGDAWTNFISILQKGWNRFAGFFQKAWARIKALVGDTDAEEEIARINEELARQDQEIEARRRQEVQAREQQRQKRRQEIDKQQADLAAAFDKIQAEERARRAARNEARRRELAEGVAEAQREFEAARQEAAQKRAEVEARRAPGRRPELPNLDDVVADAKVSVAGTFSAAAARALGGGSLAERTAKGVEQVAGNTKLLVEMARQGKLVFAD